MYFDHFSTIFTLTPQISQLSLSSAIGGTVSESRFVSPRSHTNLTRADAGFVVLGGGGCHKARTKAKRRRG